MKNKKLKLDELKLTSFTTGTSIENADTIKGGTEGVTTVIIVVRTIYCGSTHFICNEE